MTGPVHARARDRPQIGRRMRAPGTDRRAASACARQEAAHVRLPT